MLDAGTGNVYVEACVVTILDHVFQKSLELVCGGLLKNFGKLSYRSLGML